MHCVECITKVKLLLANCSWNSSYILDICHKMAKDGRARKGAAGRPLAPRCVGVVSFAFVGQFPGEITRQFLHNPISLLLLL